MDISVYRVLFFPDAAFDLVVKAAGTVGRSIVRCGIFVVHHDYQIQLTIFPVLCHLNRHRSFRGPTRPVGPSKFIALRHVEGNTESNITREVLVWRGY